MLVVGVVELMHLVLHMLLVVQGAVEMEELVLYNPLQEAQILEAVAVVIVDMVGVLLLVQQVALE
jgi:hypothetical protein